MNVFLRIMVLIMIYPVSPFSYIPKDDEAMLNYSLVSSSILHKTIAKIEELPYHVLIVYDTYFCSGGLIRSRVVLTAASCFERSTQPVAVVKVGSSTVTGYGQVIPVVEIKIHEYYKHTSEVNNDIALLALKKNVKFGPSVKKLILIDPEVALRVETTIDVSGWGHSNLPQKYLNHLVWSQMIVLNTAKCKKIYQRLVPPSSFCAKYEIERRLSDNGGPATYRNMLVGILSFGGTKRDKPHIAVFTNASYFHRWITLNSQRFLEKYCVDNEDENSKSIDINRDATI